MDQKEWRDLVWEEIKELRKENRAILETVTTLKLKLGVVMAVFSSAVSLVVSFIYKKMGLD
jgi:phosphoserine phosphatase